MRLFLSLEMRSKVVFGRIRYMSLVRLFLFEIKIVETLVYDKVEGVDSRPEAYSA